MNSFLGLKKFRERMDMQASKLAKKLNASNATYSNWENGKRDPSFEVVQKLFEMGATVEELFGVEYTEKHGYDKIDPGLKDKINHLQDLKTHFTTSDSGVYKKIDELDKRLNLMEGYGRVHELRERIKQTSNFVERTVLQRRLFEEEGKLLSEIYKAVKTKPSIQKIIKFEEKNIDVDYLVDLKIDISENDFLITFCLSKNKESNEINERITCTKTRKKNSISGNFDIILEHELATFATNDEKKFDLNWFLDNLEEGLYETKEVKLWELAAGLSGL